MSFEIKIPAVGESITSATIGEWHKKDGDTVSASDIVLTIETDKVSSDIEAMKDGVLRILVEEGEEVDIGAVVAKIEEGDGAASQEDSTEEVSEEPSTDVSATPAAKKAAEESGVDLSSIEGTGKDGGITKADVLAAADSTEEAEPEPVKEPEPVSTTAPAPRDESGRTTRKKMSPLRRKIAAQLVNAQNEAAILTTFNECDMSAVMKLRKEVQDGFVEKHGTKLGFMSFFIKAVVEALKEVPSINARIDGNEMVQNHFYDIGVAVGTEKGLVVPVVRDCDQKSFADLEKDIIDYAKSARDGKLQLDDLRGGVFTISNGGVYGSLLSTPILNPPQSGILGMHTIQQRPMAVDGQVVIRPMMYLALSYDHRIVDGKEAVTFLIRVKECIENPARLLVGA